MSEEKRREWLKQARKPRAPTPVVPVSLDAACIKLPQDYEGYGSQKRVGCDCSWGCRFWWPLEGAASGDWGVCLNPASHRVGLLTFEHQGCLKFEPEERSSNE